jgi:hypothetical protein
MKLLNFSRKSEEGRRTGNGFFGGMSSGFREAATTDFFLLLTSLAMTIFAVTSPLRLS